MSKKGRDFIVSFQIDVCSIVLSSQLALLYGNLISTSTVIIIIIIIINVKSWWRQFSDKLCVIKVHPIKNHSLIFFFFGQNFTVNSLIRAQSTWSARNPFSIPLQFSVQNMVKIFFGDSSLLRTRMATLSSAMSSLTTISRSTPSPESWQTRML